MEVDIRKIRCGGWDSSHINVKVNGRWRYLYQPNNLKPINVREPIDFTGGYKPPLPSPSIAKLIQSQQINNRGIISQNNAKLNIPIVGSTLLGAKTDSFHPTKRRFLMTSSVNRPKAPYTFYPKDKKLRPNNNFTRTINQNNFESDASQSIQNTNNQIVSQTIPGFRCPPAMSNENYQRFHEQSQKKVRIRRKSFNSYLDEKENNEVLDDNFSNISDLSMTQSSFSKTQICQSSLSSTVPALNISKDDGFSNEEDSLYFLTAAQQPKTLNLDSTFSPQKINSDVDNSDIKRPKEKRNPSINGHSKPLMKFKCMVRPQVDAGFRGDTSKLEGICIESNLSNEVKNYFIEAKERQKQLQKEYEDYQVYQEYQNYTY